MYDKMVDYIQSRIMVSKEEVERSFIDSQHKTFAKGACLLRAGEYCRFIGFVNKGLIVITIPDKDGNEKASNFVYEGCFFTYLEALASNIPSHKNFIALEDCETIMISKEKLARMFKENPKFETLLNQLLAEEVKILLFNEHAIKTLSLEERYLNLERQYPNPFQRIPLKYLADYLGIEPPSLSRLRKRLATRRN
jgi:CRP-like cAMP-binding protein